MKKIGLSLSGGGSKALAHVGVIRFLEENGIEANVLSGTSGGAIVACLYASGLNADEISWFFHETNMFSTTYYNFKKPGLIDPQKICEMIDKILPYKNFEDLEKEVYIPTTNLNTGKMRVFSKGPISRAIVASSSYPIVFAPTSIEGDYYVDGGIVNDFPADIIRDKVEKLLGVYVANMKEMPGAAFTSMKSVIDRTMEIFFATNNQVKFDMCDTFLDLPELREYGTFNVNAESLREMESMGYQRAFKVKDEILGKFR